MTRGISRNFRHQRTTIERGGTGRYLFSFCLLIGCLAGLVWRVVTLHVFEKDFLRHQGDARVVRSVKLQNPRGMILDRHGDALAVSAQTESLWLNPHEFNVDHPRVLEFSAALDLSLEQLQEKVTQSPGRGFIYLKRHLSPEAAEKVRRLALPGVHFKTEYKRYYPMGEVCAQVVGFTDIDDQGQEGLELALNSYLEGAVSRKTVVKDRLGREVQRLDNPDGSESTMAPDMPEPKRGAVSLSLDHRLQYLAYRELKAAVEKHHAAAGSAMVLDVQTGEVLAMVNQPSYNPNVRFKQRDAKYRNRAMTDVFEPGSVMKPFGVVNALQHGVVTPKTLIDTSPGQLWIGRHRVREDKNKNYGVLDVSGILQKSSNIGVTKLTFAAPPEALRETYAALGFGTLTGSHFPGESRGQLRSHSRHSFVLATMSFGYGMSTTLAQLAQAYAVLGSGGVKRPITFLKQHKVPQGEQVISPRVAREVVRMLAGVVEFGGGSRAQVMGYRVAGKTGTAKKAGAGGYREGSHIAVFAGLAPAHQPRFSIVVMVDEPQGELYYGGQVAAPVFSKIAAGALRLFDIPPEWPADHSLRVAQVKAKTPNFSHE